MTTSTESSQVFHQLLLRDSRDKYSLALSLASSITKMDQPGCNKGMMEAKHFLIFC